MNSSLQADIKTMMKQKLITFLMILLVLPLTLHAQFSSKITKVGTTAAQFLKIDAGARAIGMGGAFVAAANDATSLYWNPAGIAGVERKEIHVMHANWLGDTDFDFAAVVLPLGEFGSFGVNVTALSMPEMEVRTVFYPEGTGEQFGAGDLAAGISYARMLTDRFAIGFTAKYIRQHIWDMSASSVALDFGTLFTTGFHGMTLGMSISNFGNKMRYEGKNTQIFYDFDPTEFGDNDKLPANLQTDKWSLPLLFRVGIAMPVWNNDTNRLMFAVDAIHPNDDTENLNLGAEYAFNKRVFLRGGFKALGSKDSEEGLTLGAGFDSSPIGATNLRVDYAWADWGRLNAVHRFSLAILF
jgi:hypothetical protein